jgi:flagellar motor switch protein FliN/FliY
MSEESDGLLSQDDIDAAQDAGAGAAEAVASVADAATERAGAPSSAAAPLHIPELRGNAPSAGDLQAIDLLRDVELSVKIELGRCRMLVDDVLRLREASVVELDKLAGDPVDVFVNNRLVARGEVLVLNDNFCVRISDIVSRDFDEMEGER